MSLGIRLLSGKFNTIFRVDLFDGHKFALRVHRPGYRAAAEIRGEAAFVAAVANDGRVAVPDFRVTRESDVVARVATSGIPDGRLVSLLSWIRGRPLGAEANDQAMEAYGKATAILHEVGGRYTPRTEGLRLREAPDIDAGLWKAGPIQTLAASDRAVLQAGLQAAQAVFARFRATLGEPQPIHADLHLSNAHLFRGRLGVLDFDDAVISWPTVDLGISYFYIVAAAKDQHRARTQWAAFRKGYAMHRSWPLEDADLAPLAIARQLSILTTLLALDSATLTFRPISPRR